MLLAVDTSTRWIGLALFNGFEVNAEMVWQTQGYHTVELAPAVNSLMKGCGVKPGDLQALAVATGPGSFTSLRIGLALVKGMALALHLPLVGIPSMDVQAAAIPISPLPLAAVLRAGRGRLAVCWYSAVDADGWKPQREAQVFEFEDFAATFNTPTHVCGELTADERQALARKRKNVILASPAACLRRPAYLAELAWQRWQAGQVDDAASLSPIYLHVAGTVPG